MEEAVTLDAICTASENLVYREIEGEVIIVPLAAGVGGSEDEADAIFSLNETGRAIWERLDGQRSLRDLAMELADSYEAPLREIQADVLGLARELMRRRMLVSVRPES